MNYLPRKEYFRRLSAWLLYSEWEQVLPLNYNHQYWLMKYYFEMLVIYLFFILVLFLNSRAFQGYAFWDTEKIFFLWQ